MRKNLLMLAAAVCWLVLSAAPATAQYFGRNKVQYDDFDFKVFETEHFKFHYYPEEEEAVRDAARMAERWYRRHAQTFQHVFREKKPIIFYANDADFQQTNVISGAIGQGTGGVTESLKERVTMPLTPLYSETDHVLGHELVHSFQYDIGLNRQDSLRFRFNGLPLWFIEGMAEYISSGRQSPHTAMWLRDALLRDDLPTIEQMTRDMRYFPYRYGQAYTAYIGGKYGDAALTRLYKRAGVIGLENAFLEVLGLTTDSLSTEWKQAVRATYEPLMRGRTAPEDVGRRVLAADLDAGEMNISPSVSPDGRYVAFLSERDIFNINLYVADARTGEVIEDLDATSTDPHFDALRFISSAGTWSPDGTRFAFVTFTQGDNELAIWNVGGGIERRIEVQGVTAMTNPAWSPDGSRIAFTGMDGGVSDLYVYDLGTRQVRQLTNDRYADLQPAWSPDGRTLAFATDRGDGGSDFETLDFSPVRLGLYDLDGGGIRVLHPFGNALHHNPQFSPDGRSLYFISDHDGYKDVYRMALDGGAVRRVTRVATGVSGITELSPAMTVAAQSGDMYFSVYADNKYTVYHLEPDATQGTPAEPTGGIATARILPPIQAVNQGLVATFLDDPVTGLPPEEAYDVEDYDPSLTLDYVAPPSVGVSAGGPMGTGLQGGVAFVFSDMLGNQNLSVALQAQGTFKDIGGQVSYLNQGQRLNYGAAAMHIPLLFGGARAGYDPQMQAQIVERIYQRIFIDQIVGIAQYPLAVTRRFEVNGGFTRYGYDFEVERFAFDRLGRPIGREKQNLNELEPDASYFVHGSAAYVGDYSYFGFTSPVQGGRYRFEVSPRTGTDTYVTALADYRRYVFVNPVTFAVRGLHVGHYGADEQDMFANEYLGSTYYPGFVRGYNFRTFEPEECTSGDGSCPEIANLQGTRIAMASAELRLPLLGVERFGLINFPYLPTELVAFGDVGIAWTADEAPVWELASNTSRRTPVFSTGLSARMNVLGYMVLEAYYAYPFQRPERGPHFGFQLRPGW